MEKGWENILEPFCSGTVCYRVGNYSIFSLRNTGFSIGGIGEYIGKVYMETKHRPRLIISETAGKNNLRKKPDD